MLEELKKKVYEANMDLPKSLQLTQLRHKYILTDKKLQKFSSMATVKDNSFKG